MRGNPESHEFVSCSSLAQVLAHLAETPGEWTPIAGGTEIMVANAAGRLQPSKLINLWGLPELGGIHVSGNALFIGGGVTFGEIRSNAAIQQHFPLLAKAASWIGSIANQNRATIAGNIVNGSPAADAPPALLVYDAAITLISQRGRRTIPYQAFHTGYKTNVLQPDELVYSIFLPIRFGKHAQYLRKVGTRRAMAITKVGLAGTALLEDRVFKELRLSGVSVADRPVRLTQTENSLLGQPLNAETKKLAIACLLDEVKPIDDIRSNADYRRQVAANLLAEFLDELTAKESQS